MTKGKGWGALLAASLAFTASTSASAETIKIGTEGAYPPFNYYTADGQLAGFDIEIGKALCSEMKVECEFVAQDWDGIIPALLAGKYDMILASMFITEARQQQVSFSAPYQASAMTFVVDKNSGIKDVSPKAMKGLIIGAQSSTTQAEYLLANYPESDVRLYPTQDAVNLDLASGRIDAQAGDIMPMTDWLSSDDGACCHKAGDLITDSKYVGDGVGIALRKEDDALRQRVNQALANIIKDGTYQKINDEFFKINLLTLK
ncbi:transporter substrate-binding domain-containing protein [Vibrio sp. Vb2880]|nr:transporter substrate-binding domain-containing protein [Vibrio sp. Vb2880]MBO0213072.1 transporter substrate-binding domain-containing protein [Vibrio sp. Vb2880]